MQNPGYWRERAEETRVKADSFRYQTPRKSLLKVAEQYDRLRFAKQSHPKERRLNPAGAERPGNWRPRHDRACEGLWGVIPGRAITTAWDRAHHRRSKPVLALTCVNWCQRGSRK